MTTPNNKPTEKHLHLIKKGRAETVANHDDYLVEDANTKPGELLGDVLAMFQRGLQLHHIHPTPGLMANIKRYVENIMLPRFADYSQAETEKAVRAAKDKAYNEGWDEAIKWSSARLAALEKGTPNERKNTAT